MAGLPAPRRVCSPGGARVSRSGRPLGSAGQSQQPLALTALCKFFFFFTKTWDHILANLTQFSHPGSFLLSELAPGLWFYLVFDRLRDTGETQAVCSVFRRPAVLRGGTAPGPGPPGRCSWVRRPGPLSRVRLGEAPWSARCPSGRRSLLSVVKWGRAFPLEEQGSHGQGQCLLSHTSSCRGAETKRKDLV